MKQSDTARIEPDDDVIVAVDVLGDLPGFTDQFPHLRRLLHATLMATGHRYDAAADELDRIGELKRLGDAVDEALGNHVLWCREILGYSWAEIGEALGVSRQGARQRFASDSDPDTPEADRLVAETEYLLAKMRVDSAKAALENGSPAGVVCVAAADFERYVEVLGERRRLAQQALESRDDAAVAPSTRRSRS